MSPSAQTRTFRQRVTHVARWLFLAALTAAALLTVGRIYVVERLDEEIRRRVQDQIASSYPALRTTIQSARRIEGRGIEVRGLTISDPQSDDDLPILHIDEIFLACPTDLATLLSGDVGVYGLTVRRMRLRAVRQTDGSWNLQQFWPLPSLSEDAPPDAVLEDARVEFVDKSRPDSVPFVLHGVHARLKPRGNELRLDGQMNVGQFARVTTDGALSLDEGSWKISGTVGGLEVSPRLVRALPPEIGQYLTPLEQVRTRAELQFEVARNADVRDIRFVVQGNVFEGRIDDARLPHPLDDVAAEVYCDNRQLSFRKFKARTGGATLGFDADIHDWLSEPKISFRGGVKQLLLDRRLRDALPVSFQATWDKFAPAGTVDVYAELVRGHAKDLTDVKLTCHDLSFAYEKFPYPLHHGRGLVTFRDGRLKSENLIASASGQVIRIGFDLQDPGPDSLGWVDVRSDGPVPIDRQLIHALNEKGQRVLHSLNPTGSLTLTKCRFERINHQSLPTKHLELQVSDGSLQFVDFPYPISKVGGKIVASNDIWELQNFSGIHGTTQLVCNGAWFPDPSGQPGIQLDLHFVGTDVAFDEDLQKALAVKNAGAARTLQNLRPRGALDYLSVDLNYATAQGKPKLTVRAHERTQAATGESQSVSIHPTWLPYRIDRVTGVVGMSQGRIELQELSGWHDQTQWRCGGVCDLLPNQQWHLKLNQLTADQLSIDHDLLEAMPQPLGPALHGLKLNGVFSLQGSLAIQGAPQQPLTAQWNVLVDVAHGRMLNKEPIRNVHGAVRFIGQKTRDQAYTFGELDIDSLHYKGVQVTQLRGPMFIDSTRVLFGSRAEAGRVDRAPRQVKGRLLGGVMTLDAFVPWNPELAYEVLLTLDGASLQQLVQQVSNQPRDVEGKISGSVSFGGYARAAHTRRGQGFLRLRDADIYELPVMVTLLSVLSLKAPDSSGFTTSDIDFRLEGDLVHLDRINLYGDAITLKGNGWVNTDQIQLNFYTLVGRNEFQLPVISDFLAEASRRILEIQVVGTLSDPRVQRTAFPELDDTLQTLFPELRRRREQQREARLPSMLDSASRALWRN